MAGGDELAFRIPIAKVEELMAGLRYLETTDSRLPHNYQMSHKEGIRESYLKIAKMIGMSIDT